MADSGTQCPIPKEKILDFLLEELSYEETVRIDEHLRECKLCGAAAESYGSLFTILRDKKPVEVKSETYFKLKEKVFEKHHTRSRSAAYNYMQKISLVLSAAAVLLFTFLLTDRQLFYEIPQFGQALNESWLIDTSTVYYERNIGQSGDTLLSQKPTAEHPVKFFVPAFTLKKQAAIPNRDILDEKHFLPSLSGYPSGSPLILMKNKRVISYFHPKRSKPFLLISC